MVYHNHRQMQQKISVDDFPFHEIKYNTNRLHNVKKNTTIAEAPEWVV